MSCSLSLHEEENKEKKGVMFLKQEGCACVCVWRSVCRDLMSVSVKEQEEQAQHFALCYCAGDVTLGSALGSRGRRSVLINQSRVFNRALFFFAMLFASSARALLPVPFAVAPVTQQLTIGHLFASTQSTPALSS